MLIKARLLWKFGAFCLMTIACIAFFADNEEVKHVPEEEIVGISLTESFETPTGKNETGFASDETKIASDQPPTTIQGYASDEEKMASDKPTATVQGYAGEQEKLANDKPTTTVQGDFGKVCIVVRTYRGHGLASPADLFTLSSSLIPSFQAFEYQNWVSLFLDTDADRVPFTDLDSVLGQYKDERLVPLNAQQVAKGIPVIYIPNDSAYDLTDKAIRFCPTDTKWLVVTQGDNAYKPEFLSSATLSTDVDIVSVDWYSRHGCDCKDERFCCIPNETSHGKTDLGSNIVNFQRFVKENRLYGREHRNGEQDGYMMDRLRTSGWTIKRIENCLFSHSPNPAGCQSHGGYWVNGEQRCATPEEAISKQNNKELTLFTHPNGFRCLVPPVVASL